MQYSTFDCDLNTCVCLPTDNRDLEVACMMSLIAATHINYRLRGSPEVTTSNRATDADREATSINRKMNCVCIILHCQLGFDASTETKITQTLNIVNKPARKV